MSTVFKKSFLTTFQRIFFKLTELGAKNLSQASLHKMKTWTFRELRNFCPCSFDSSVKHFSSYFTFASAWQKKYDLNKLHLNEICLSVRIVIWTSLSAVSDSQNFSFFSFDTFSEIHFWPTDPKIFLKAPLAPIYTNFEGERAPKKTRFFCQNFSKSAQKRLFWLFFQKFACGAENLAKMGAKSALGELQKSIWST